MKKVLHAIKEYTDEYFNIKLYLLIALFLIISIALNYYFDFEDSYVDAYRGKPIRAVWYFFLQSSPYYIVCLLVAKFTNYNSFLKNKSFWLISVFGFIVQGIDRSFYYHAEVVKTLSRDILYFVYQLLGDASSIVIIGIPLLVYYFLWEHKKMKSFYGLTNKISDLKPYLFMLGIVFLLIIPASFLSDFQASYPHYQDAQGSRAASYYNVPEWMIVAGFETMYGLSFLVVELFFRGFLILVFMRYLGPYVVLPMVASYVFLHFGKPLGETISSAFGGYVLGILVYKTKNIWGGVVIHMGVALSMELVAYLQKIIFQ